MSDSPAVILYDDQGNPIGVSGNPLAVSATSMPLPSGASTAAKQPAFGAAGTASADVLSVQGVASMTPLKVDGSASTQPVSGTVSVSNYPSSQTVSGSVSVSNFPATQPVSAASLPLPNGASTAAKQPAIGTAGTASADVLTVQGIASMTALKVDGSGATQPVSAASLPLPSGASTSALQSTGNTSLSSIDTKTPALVSGRVPVDIGSSSISGTVAVSNFPATQAISAASLPLPAGAATSAKQPAVGTAGTAASDVMTVQGIASMTPLKVDGSAATQPVSGSVTVSNFPSSQSVSGSVTVSNFPATQPVSATTLPLPTGAATSAKQPALGTAGTAATDVLTVQGIASMTALKVDGSASTQPVSGTVSVSNFPSSQSVSGSVTVSNFPATQPVSAATLPLPTGAATSAKQPALGTAGSASADVLTVQGATNMTALKVDGSGSTQPISASALPLPSGAATSALQTTGNTSVGNIDTKTPALVSGRVPVDGSGVTQPISASALPLPNGASTAAKQPAIGTAGTPSTDVLTVQGAASMTALKVDASATTQPISAAALPLPSGASTSALQTTGNTSLSNIDTKTPALVTGRVPVDGSGVTQPVSASSLPLPSGAATETTLGTRLADATFTARVPTVGQKDKTASLPVVLASDQPAIPVTVSAATDTTGSGSLAALNQAVTLGPMVGCGHVDVYVTGTFVANLTVETSPDNITWNATIAADPTQAIAPNQVINTTGRFVCQPGGPYFRVRCSSYNSGTASVKAAAGTASNSTVISGALPGGFNFIGKMQLSDTNNLSVIKPGSSAAVASDPALVVAISPNNDVDTRITDGTNYAAVKPASTAAAATDPALVVAISPNSPLSASSSQGTAAAIAGAWPVKLTDGTTQATFKAASVATVPTDTAMVVDVRPSQANYYSWQYTGTAYPATNMIDYFTLSGSASKTVLVQRLILSTTQGTAGTNTWYLLKRLGANSGGTTITNITPSPWDSNSPAATAAGIVYTANATTVGQPIQYLASFKHFSPTATTTTGADRIVYDCTNNGQCKGLTLRGTSQFFTLSFNGVTPPTGMSISLTVEWIEH